MEVFIVGLIVYVILSVIGEVAKKNKNTPPPQTGGGKVIPFPSDPDARRKSFQDVLREALEEASLEGEGSKGPFGEGAGADEAGVWLPQRNGSLTSEEMMERMEEGFSSEGLSSENLSSEGFSSEGLGSLEGTPPTDGSLGGNTRWGSLESIPEESHSSGRLGPIPEDAHSSSLLKSSAGGDEFSHWEHEDLVDFADDAESTTDSRFSYGEIGFSESGFDVSPIFLKRGLLTSEDDLLSGIIVSEILNTPGGKGRQRRGARGPRRFVRS